MGARVVLGRQLDHPSQHDGLAPASQCFFNVTCGRIAITSKTQDPPGIGTEVYNNIALVDIDRASVNRNDHNISGQNVTYVGPTTTYAGHRSPPARSGNARGLTGSTWASAERTAAHPAGRGADPGPIIDRRDLPRAGTKASTTHQRPNRTRATAAAIFESPPD